MNFIKGLVITSMAIVAASASAAPEEASVKHGRWTVHAGYAWRAQAKTDFSGSAPLVSGGTYDNGYAKGDTDWQGSDIGTLPAAMPPGVNGDGTDWALNLTRSESVCSGSDEEGMHGFKFGAGYDFYSGDLFDVALLVDFAGYWGLENSTQGGYNRYTDTFRGTSLFDTTPDPTLDSIDPAAVQRQYLAGGAASAMRTKLKADLYQIGLGPQVTWHAFEGWCRPLSWIDLYGNVEVLCNIIHSELDAGAASTSDTSCKIGFGGNVGFVGNITDWCGVYGQIGYEWIDKTDIETHGCKAETDFSSLVLSAGVQFRF